jgi:hypothetical protein
MSDWLGRCLCLPRDVTVSHATWPLLPFLPTVNGSQLPQTRTFIVRFGGDSDVQCTKAELCCMVCMSWYVGRLGRDQTWFYGTKVQDWGSVLSQNG